MCIRDKVYPGRPDSEVGAHDRHYNAHSIGICYEGGLDKKMCIRDSIKLVKNKNKTIKEAYGKYYARPVVTETIGIDELAEHMASHNTPFSKSFLPTG